MATVKHTHSAPTDKQVAYAEALARGKGYRYLSEAYKARFGKNKIGGFNRAETSDLIEWLKG